MESPDLLYQHIDEALLGIPNYLDHLAAIEDSARGEIEEEIKEGWLTYDEGELILRALHTRIFGESQPDLPEVPQAT